MFSFLQHPSKTHGPTKFPQELYDLFIDKLARIATPSDLKSCNRVSRSFSHRARQYLFRQVKLIEDEPEKSNDLMYDVVSFANTLQKCQQILEFKPKRDLTSTMTGIAPFVKRLVVCLWLPDSSVRKARKPRPLRPRIVSFESLLVNIMGLLDGNTLPYGIESFSFSITPLGTTTTLQHEIGPVFAKAFYHLIRSPRLRTLELKGVPDLPFHLLNGTHITTLAIFGHKIVYGRQAPDSIKSFQRPALSNFSTDLTIPPSSLFVPPIRHNTDGNPGPSVPSRLLELHPTFANLCTLAVNIYSLNEYRETQKLLRANSGGLRILHVTFINLSDALISTLAPFDFENIQGLVRFRMEFRVSASRVVPLSQSMQYCWHFLKGTTRMRCNHLVLCVTTLKTELGAIMATRLWTHDPELYLLDEILVTSRFNHLFSLSFEVVVRHPSPRSIWSASKKKADAMLESIRMQLPSQLFPKLLAKSGVDVTVQTSLVPL